MDLNTYFDKNDDGTLKIDFNDTIFTEYNPSLNREDLKIKLTSEMEKLSLTKDEAKLLVIKMTIFIIYWLVKAASSDQFNEVDVKIIDNKLISMNIPSNFLDIIGDFNRNNAVCV